MSLRKELVRLAYQNPSLRGDILPLITKSAERVQVVRQDTGKTVSVEKSTLNDPEKKKLYAPVEENSGKKKTERTDEERVMNIVENQAKKEGWTKAELDKMKKRLKGMSKSTMRGYLAAMGKYETDEDPNYEPEFATEKDKEDKAKADKEEAAKKLRNKQKSVSNKILTDKKIDEIAESLKDKRVERTNIHGFKPKINWRGVKRDLQEVASSDDTYGAIEKYLEENKSWSPEYLKPFEDLKKEIEELAEKEPDVKRTKSKEQKYKDAIKNSDMSAEDKKKAIDRLKDPKFDLDGALAGMGDDEEDGSKDASLRSSLIRLAYNQPKLRLQNLSQKQRSSKMLLRNKLIRLAYENPSLRGDILPLITKSAAETFEGWVKKQNQKGFPNPNPKRRNKIKFKSLPKEDQKKIREDWTKAKEKADAEKEAKKPESHKKFDEMFKKLDPDVSEELPSPDQMDEWGEGDNLAEKYELWLEENSWVKGENEDENGVDDNDRIKEWIKDHASKWEEQTKGGKKATLRSSLIRLAYNQPKLRDDLLPLITKSAIALKPSKSGLYTLSFFVGQLLIEEAFNSTDREHKKQFAKAMEYTKKLFSGYNTKWHDQTIYVTVNTQELKEISALLSRMWKGGDSIRIQVAPFYGLSDFRFYYGIGSRNKTPVTSNLKAVLQFSKIAKTAGKHYDRWEMWSKLLKRSGLIVEIERNPMPMYVTELKVFYSRHKQFHNVDTLMGDIYATIGYDRNGTEFTVHTGNKSSGYNVGDEKYALRDILRYFK